MAAISLGLLLVSLLRSRVWWLVWIYLWRRVPFSVRSSVRADDRLEGTRPLSSGQDQLITWDFLHVLRTYGLPSIGVQSGSLIPASPHTI